MVLDNPFLNITIVFILRHGCGQDHVPGPRWLQALPRHVNRGLETDGAASQGRRRFAEIGDKGFVIMARDNVARGCLAIGHAAKNTGIGGTLYYAVVLTERVDEIASDDNDVPCQVADEKGGQVFAQECGVGEGYVVLAYEDAWCVGGDGLFQAANMAQCASEGAVHRLDGANAMTIGNDAHLVQLIAHVLQTVGASVEVDVQVEGKNFVDGFWELCHYNKLQCFLYSMTSNKKQGFSPIVFVFVFVLLIM